MKKKTRYGFLLLLCFCYTKTLPAQSSLPNDLTWQQGVRYVIEAALDTTERRLNGSMRIYYQNNSPDTLRQIYLQVPSNAFHNQENTAVKEMQRFTGGSINFEHRGDHKLTIESLQFLSIGRETEFPLQAYDFSDTILELTLPYSLLPGDTLSLGVIFFQDFDKNKRTSRRKRSPADFEQWFPRLAVYDQSGWHDEPFHFMMESFDIYSEFADFDVTLTVPWNNIVAGSGAIVEGDPGWEAVTADTSLDKDAFVAWRDSVRMRLKEEGREKGFRSVRFKAEKVQNFTWSASPKYLYFRYDRRIPVHIFFRGKKPKSWLNGLLSRFDGAWDYLENYFGAYPFSHVTVIKASSKPMADPMLVRLEDDDEFAMAYELTSVYFPGVVGVNGVKESWLTKGLQVYMGKSYSEKIFGKKGYDTEEAQEDMNWFEKQYPLPALDALVRNVARLYNESGQNEPMANTIHGYKDPVGTFFNLYLKADIFYEMLRYVVGDSAFKTATQELIRRHAFSHVNEKDVQAVFEDSHGEKLDWFFDQWLRRTPTVDYSKGKIEKVKRGDSTWVTTVEVKRKGDGVMPIDVELDLGGGEKQTKRWDGKARSGVVVFETTKKPKAVQVDPDDRIMDSNRLNNRRPRWEFRPDWPLLKYIHMPGDAILVLWRPLAGFNKYDSVRLGIRTSSSYRAFYHNLTLEAMFGIDSRELDAKIAYSHPISHKSLMNRYHLMARKNEGRFEADAHLSFRGSQGILSASGRSLDIGLNYSGLLNDAYTFREVKSDTGTFQFDEWEDKDILLAYVEGQLQLGFWNMDTEARVRIETALPAGEMQFTKLSSRVQLSFQPLGLRGKIRGNVATSFGPDQLPLQDQFRAEGAAARERFHNDLVKTGEAWGAFSRRYVEGGGFLRGYAGQPLPAERYATLNVELGLNKSFWLFRPFGFYDAGRIWATRSAPSFTRSGAGFGLNFLFEELKLFGGNLGLFSNFSAKLIFPIWISDPLPGEARRQFRWFFSLGKGL